ncbi:MAG: hypothetical protein CL468_06075 [Acidimicrobiaceae bacterium]|nr:hypothetical protein [Acidimicrobiaceae bacterium]
MRLARLSTGRPPAGGLVHATDACLKALRVSDLTRAFHRPATADHLHSVVTGCRITFDPGESDG